jgi:hypothetical protein
VRQISSHNRRNVGIGISKNVDGVSAEVKDKGEDEGDVEVDNFACAADFKHVAENNLSSASSCWMRLVKAVE